MLLGMLLRTGNCFHISFLFGSQVFCETFWTLDSYSYLIMELLLIQYKFIVAINCVAAHDSPVLISEVTCSYLYPYSEKNFDTLPVGTMMGKWKFPAQEMEIQTQHFLPCSCCT